MSNKKIGHHYISATYQRNFCKDDGKSWYLEPSGRIFDTKPENMFKENHYNTVNGSLGIEDDLSKLESDFSSLVENKIKKHIMISKEEKAILSLYTSVLFTHIRQRREALRGFYQRLSVRGANVEESFLSTTPTEGGGISIKEIDDVLKNFNPHFAESSMNSAIHSAEYIFTMNWKFLIAPTEEMFISSDTPVNLCRPLAENEFGYEALGSRAGLKHSDVELTFPLTPSIMLLCGYINLLEQDLVYLEAPSNWINNLNIRTMRQADILFSNSKQALEEILKKYPDVKEDN